MPRLSPLVVCCLAAGFGFTEPISGQTMRQIPLDLGRGEIGRRYLPARDTFLFVVRVASEARELRGQYRRTDGPEAASRIELAPWPRTGGTRSRDATLIVGGLEPGASYRFEFTLIRRPTGNEGRLVENAVTAALHQVFRADPTAELADAIGVASDRIRSALTDVLPRAAHQPGSAFDTSVAALEGALGARDVGRIQAEYRHRHASAAVHRDELVTARARLAAIPLFAATLDRIAARISQGDGIPELAEPLAMCRALLAPAAPRDFPLASDTDQLATLDALEAYGARADGCRGLLRDVRLPRYADRLRIDEARSTLDLLSPVTSRLDAFRTETERLLALWQRRDRALQQVGSDLRRSLDTDVTIDSVVTATFTAQPAEQRPPSATIGAGLATVWTPCSTSGECLRIVPQATVSFRIRHLLGAEIGLTLADTDAPGRTRHLFWFNSAMIGPTLRLGATRSQRLGAGVLILRNASGENLDVFHLGGYLSFTVLDFRL